MLKVNGRLIDVPYSGLTARVNFGQDIVDTIRVNQLDVPVYINTSGIVKGLPDPQDDTIYIASRLVAEYVRRPDVLCPNKAPGHVDRDSYGRPRSVDSLLAYE